MDDLQRCVAGASIQRLDESLQTTEKGFPVLAQINLGTLRGREGNQNAIQISGEVKVGAGVRRVKDQRGFHKLGQLAEALTPGGGSPQRVTLLLPSPGHLLAHVAAAEDGTPFARGQDGSLLLGQQLVEGGQIWGSCHSGQLNK